MMTRDATCLGIASGLLAVGQFVLVSYVALYLLTVFGVPLSIGSLCLFAINMGGIVGRMLWGAVSDRLFAGHRGGTLIVIGCYATAGLLILAVLPRGIPLWMTFVLVIGLGAVMVGWNGVYITLLAELTPPEMRGSVVAYGLTFTQIGIFVGPFAFGVIVEACGSYRIGWAIVAAVVLSGTMMIRLVREPVK
jgi:predicted MFS family arabinose efflux permease